MTHPPAVGQWLLLFLLLVACRSGPGNDAVVPSEDPFVGRSVALLVRFAAVRGHLVALP